MSNIKRTTVEEVLQEITASGTFSATMQSEFMAQHRVRPMAKVVITDQIADRYTIPPGMQLRFIVQTTPDFEKALPEALFQLMCDYIEGKVSIKTIEGSGVSFVCLSDSLVDISLTRSGWETLFNVLQTHTPVDFLDKLAARLMEIYAVDVSIIDGKDGGLVFRKLRD